MPLPRDHARWPAPGADLALVRVRLSDGRTVGARMFPDPEHPGLFRSDAVFAARVGNDAGRWTGRREVFHLALRLPPLPGDPARPADLPDAPPRLGRRRTVRRSVRGTPRSLEVIETVNPRVDASLTYWIIGADDIPSTAAPGRNDRPVPPAAIARLRAAAAEWDAAGDAADRPAAPRAARPAKAERAPAPDRLPDGPAASDAAATLERLIEDTARAARRAGREHGERATVYLLGGMVASVAATVGVIVASPAVLATLAVLAPIIAVHAARTAWTEVIAVGRENERARRSLRRAETAAAEGRAEAAADLLADAQTRLPPPEPTEHPAVPGPRWRALLVPERLLAWGGSLAGAAGAAVAIGAGIVTAPAALGLAVSVIPVLACEPLRRRGSADHLRARLAGWSEHYRRRGIRPPASVFEMAVVREERPGVLEGLGWAPLEDGRCPDCGLPAPGDACGRCGRRAV